MVAEDLGDIVADDVAQNPSENGRDHPQDNGHQGGLTHLQAELGAAGGKQTHANRIGPEHGALRWFQMAPPHEQHGRDAQQQHGPQQLRVGDPEERPAVQQHISQGAAAKGRQARDHHHTHGIQTPPRSFHDAGTGKGQGGHRFNQVEGRAEVQGGGHVVALGFMLTTRRPRVNRGSVVPGSV